MSSDDQSLPNQAPEKKPALERDLSASSDVAGALLDNVLEAESPEEKLRQTAAVDIDEARMGERLITNQTGRSQSRILLLTEDLTYLEPNSHAVGELNILAGIFDEIHVMVLAPIGEKEVISRVGDNAWVYRLGYKYWWRVSAKAKACAEENLFFADNFRADIVVAKEPYLAGLAGLSVARHFGRVLQLHVLEDFFTPQFKRRERKNKWLVRLAKYVIPRSDSVRVATASIKESLTKNIKKAPKIEILPRFYNLSALLKSAPALDLHEIYKDFSFIILAFAPLSADSPLQDVFAGLNKVLHNPRVGLVVVGDGLALNLYQEKAQILGIERNVVFKKTVEDSISYMQSADMLVQTDVTKDGDGIIFQAAAAGLPMVMYETDLRNDLFKDGESASLCPVGDTYALAVEVNNFLNNPTLRKQYETNARNVVQTRLLEDEATYYQAYRDSIETAILDNQ